MASRVLKTGENQITTVYHSAHKGVDIVKYNHALDDIVAHTSGKVVFCQTGHKNNKGASGNASYGNCVKIDHGDGYSTLYAHLASVTVKLGDKVTQGQTLGRMGNTGNSYGAHLHFEVRKDNQRIDPTPYLEADLPLSEAIPNPVRYRVFTGKRWLPYVTDYNLKDANGYAGITGKAASGIEVKPARGQIRMRVHQIKGKRWLPWVYTSEDYAGNLGQPIDAIQMELINMPGYQIKYRVSPKSGKGWYGWCVGLTDATGDGYAGVFGKAIDCIQMQIVKE